MTNTSNTGNASDFYAGVLEANIGKGKTVTIKTLAGTDTTARVERVGDGVVTLMTRKKTYSRELVQRWDIRIDHISVVYTADEETAD